jgi:hypothetical protein
MEPIASFKKGILMKTFILKKYSLSLLYLIICLCAFGQDDHYFHFFYEHEGERYYLSAVDGGGDEIVAKKGTPGDYEKFHLQYVRKEEGGEKLYRIKTANQYYLSLDEDRLLSAEEKDVAPSQLFEVSKKLRKENRTIKGGKEIITENVELRITHIGISWRRHQLAFVPELEEFRWYSFPRDSLNIILAEEIRIEMLPIQTYDPKEREFEYRLLFVDGDSAAMACLFRQQIFVFDRDEESKHLPLYQWERERRFVLKGEPTYFHVQYRGDYGTSCPLPRIVLLKEGREMESWTFDESLRNGQQIRLMMDGRIIKMY